MVSNREKSGKAEKGLLEAGGRRRGEKKRVSCQKYRAFEDNSDNGALI